MNELPPYVIVWSISSNSLGNTQAVQRLFSGIFLSLRHSPQTKQSPQSFRLSSVYSFSSSCPKTVSRTREVFPTGSTTLLRLQLSRTRDCAHRSRHVGLFLFFFFWRERCLPKVSWKSNPAAPGLANQVWPFKSALCVPGKTLMVGWGLLAHASRGHFRWSVEGWACLSSFQLKGLYDRTRETHS